MIIEKLGDVYRAQGKIYGEFVEGFGESFLEALEAATASYQEIEGSSDIADPDYWGDK